MYHDSPVINDIVLTIINDGNGSQCGMTYEDRCANTHNAALSKRLFRDAASRYTGSNRYLADNADVPRSAIITAARILFDYYLNHVTEVIQCRRIK